MSKLFTVALGLGVTCASLISIGTAAAACRGTACYLVPPPSRLAPAKPGFAARPPTQIAPGVKPGAGIVAAGGGNFKPGAGLVSPGGGNFRPGAGIVAAGGGNFRPR